MIGDIREHGYVRPLGMDTMQKFIDNGFKLKEIIIKEQHNCRSTSYWEKKDRSFLNMKTMLDCPDYLENCLTAELWLC